METWLEEILPEELLFPEAAPRLVGWLRRQPIDPADRKLLLVTWCDYTGVKLTRELVIAGNAE